MWEVDEEQRVRHCMSCATPACLPAPEKNCYQLHALAHRYAESLLTETETNLAAFRHSKYYETMLRQLNQRYLQGGANILPALALFDASWPNIRAGQTWAASLWEENDDVAHLCAEYPDSGADFLILRLHVLERIVWLGAALAAARHLGNQKQQVRNLRKLGNAYLDLGAFKRAIDYCKQALTIALEIGNRRGEGRSLWQMSQAYAKLTDLPQAIALAEEALAIFEAIEDPSAEKVREQLALWKAV